MYQTPVSNRLHIGIFGRRNVGKSSLINAITGQHIAITSEKPGTTTDPVYKTMEILPIGPCVLIDTAGIDDEGDLGAKRIEKTLKVLRKTDVGILVVEPGTGIGDFENKIFDLFKEKKIPNLTVVNKIDIENPEELVLELEKRKKEYIEVSSHVNTGIEGLKNRIISIAPDKKAVFPLIRDIISQKATVVMVCPVDGAMPQGRLILPQVQVLREILDANATAFVSKETELENVLNSLKTPPELVITDSQVFEMVKDIVPEEVPLTSFSIVFARHKGDLSVLVEGVNVVPELEDGDEILIAEACTHHVQPEDIGRSKIPAWLMHSTGKDLAFDIVSGGDFPEDLSRYRLIIGCGGCMINRAEMLYRIEKARLQNIPITNYGVIIAYFSGILDRAIAPFLKMK